MVDEEHTQVGQGWRVMVLVQALRQDDPTTSRDYTPFPPARDVPRLGES